MIERTNAAHMEHVGYGGTADSLIDRVFPGMSLNGDLVDVCGMRGRSIGPFSIASLSGLPLLVRFGTLQ